MEFGWNIWLYDLGIIGCVVGSIWIINKKLLKGFKTNAPMENKTEMNRQGMENMTSQFLASPAGAIVAQSLHLEVNRLSESLKISEVWRLILTGLCSFKESPNSMNFTQKYVLISYVMSSAPKEWGIDQQMIADILLEIDQKVETFSSQEIVKAANVFTMEYNKNKNPVSDVDSVVDNTRL